MGSSKRLMARAEAREDVISYLASRLEDELSMADAILILNDRLKRIKVKADARWCRFAFQNGTPVLPDLETRFDTVIYRLDPARKSSDLYLQLAASRMESGALLWMLGSNDEGVKSAAKNLSPYFEQAETYDYKKRARIIRAVRNEIPADGRISAWKSQIELDSEHHWNTYPGLFAGGGHDGGTKLLLEALKTEKFKPESKVCDWGCGSGVLTHGISLQRPDAVITGLDADALAIEAYQQNCSYASAILSDGWNRLPTDSRFHIICSNPPMHIGKSEDFRMIQACIQDSPSRLHSSGILYLVVLRQIPIQSMLEPHFKKVEMIAENNRYWVWKAVKQR
ncbi:MAG: methyltransferase [Myxococcota bacterium]|nr:methyltransferase [Myxococcota bacterium]MEC8381124.1 methyltransferase [Myxococcota bacterium]